MWGKKKPAVSALRYCRTAHEISPLLFRYEFTVAVARIEGSQVFPLGEERSIIALGVLHGAGTFEDGSLEPILPVRITVVSPLDPAPKTPASISGEAELDFINDDPNSHYVLNIFVRDLNGRFSDALVAAAVHGAVSKYNFVHLDFGRERSHDNPPSKRPSFEEQQAEDTAFADRVDAGEAYFPAIKFDYARIRDFVRLDNPGWSCLWSEDSRLRAPIFHDKGTAHYRAKAARWRKPN